MGKITDECGHMPIFEALEPRLLLDNVPPSPLMIDLQASNDGGFASESFHLD